MYTVEFNPANAVITSLDERDAFDDVKVILCEDNTVFIEQHVQSSGDVNVIYMSYQQLLDIVAAQSSTEGLYRLEIER